MKFSCKKMLSVAALSLMALSALSSYQSASAMDHYSSLNSIAASICSSPYNQPSSYSMSSAEAKGYASMARDCVPNQSIGERAAMNGIVHNNSQYIHYGNPGNNNNLILNPFYGDQNPAHMEMALNRINSNHNMKYSDYHL